jgi:hypothetical protein
MRWERNGEGSLSFLFLPFLSSIPREKVQRNNAKSKSKKREEREQVGIVPLD